MQFIMNQHQIKNKSLTVGAVKKKKKNRNGTNAKFH